ADVCYPLAVARGEQRRLPEARVLIERARRIHEAKFPPDNPTLAMDYDVLGMIAHREGKYDEAHEWGKKAIAIKERAYAAPHEGTAISYDLDAAHLLALGRRGDARAELDRAMDLYKK